MTFPALDRSKELAGFIQSKILMVKLKMSRRIYNQCSTKIAGFCLMRRKEVELGKAENDDTGQLLVSLEEET